MSKKKIIILIFIILVVLLVVGMYFYKAQGIENKITELSENEYENMKNEYDVKNTKIEENHTSDNEKVDELVEDVQDELQNKNANEDNVEAKKSLASNSQNTIKKEKSKVVIEEKTTEQVQEIPQVVETPKIQEQPKIVEQKTEEPKKEKKIYCVDGGNVHIYGDGPNEHGFYKTWDEAFKAYEDYTVGWDGAQFMVDQCACGLYYFWVIK